MQLNADHIIGRLCLAGINHTKAGTVVRGQFSVDQLKHTHILNQARQMGLQSVFVISTCNRTEIYGYANHPCELATLLTAHTKGTMQELLHQGYLLQGKDALQHLFKVAAGLDSQIVGDFEIQGQLKQAYKVAQQNEMIGPIMDRTINFVFQASKKIRSATALSSGTVSVSFAAIEWLQKRLDNSPKKLLVIGSGKFGRNVGKNIRHYLPQCSLFLTNRTHEAGLATAAEMGAEYLPFKDLELLINDFDIVVVCTNAMEPIVKACHFSTNQAKLIIDLSMPANVEPQVGLLPNITLANVDEISAIPEKTISRRQKEIPRAMAILADFENQFGLWLQTYQHAPAIRQIKKNLHQLSAMLPKPACEMAQQLLSKGQMLAHPEVYESTNVLPLNANSHEMIHKAVSNLLVGLKTNKDKGCQFITAYHRFLNETDGPLHHS